jgi:hypothetical protein
MKFVSSVGVVSGETYEGSPEFSVPGARVAFAVTPYFGSPSAISEGPQAFLVELHTPGSVVRPHFHTVPQFQVVVTGDGWLGKQSMKPFSFHFADAHTPYGPILAGEQGLSFFTLRAEASVGALYMPGSRAKMARRAGRNVVGHTLATRAVATERNASAAWEMLILPNADGLMAAHVHLGAGGEIGGVGLGRGGGQYYLVTAGALVHGSEELPTCSLLFAGSGEPDAWFRAGPSGADLLFLQFPSVDRMPT